MAVTLADAIVYLAADNTRLKKDLDKAKGKTKTWTDTVSTMAGNLLSRGIAGVARIAWSAVQDLGTALKDAVVESVKLAGDFESQVAGLGIAAKASGLSMDELHDAALRVGGDTSLLGVSATGAADAMTGLFKAGLTAGEIFGDLGGYMEGTTELGGALRASIDLAAASELDMVAASDLAAIALATFGGELTSSEERAAFVTSAMDNLVKAADASVAEVDGLAQAMSFVGSTFFAAGYDVETMNNALAILSTAGLDAGRAGRNLQSMITSLINPTNDGRSALRELNTEIYDSEGNMRSLRDIIGDLAAGTEHLTQVNRDRTLGDLFTNAGIRAALPLIQANVEGWDAMADATEKATGIQEQAAIKAATLAGRMEALEGNVETLKIEIGEKLLPYLTDFVNWLIPFVDQHGPAFVTAVGGIADAFISVGRWLFAFLDSTDILNDWITHIPGPLGEVVSTIANGLAPSVESLLDAFVKLGEALGLDEGDGGWIGVLFGQLMDMGIELLIFSIANAIDSLTNAINATVTVIEVFRGLWESIQGIQLPAWLTPGSPTPFELGIRGITDAMTDLFSIGTPSLQAAFGGLAQGNQDNRRDFTNYGGIQMFPQEGSGNPLEQLWEMGNV